MRAVGCGADIWTSGVALCLPCPFVFIFLNFMFYFKCLNESRAGIFPGLPQGILGAVVQL